MAGREKPRQEFPELLDALRGVSPNSLGHLLNVQGVYLQYGLNVQILKYCLGYCFGLMGRLRAVLDTKFARRLTLRLHQPQFAGTCYGFGAPLDLQFAKDNPIVSFNSTQGEEKPLANLTIRESLGNEL